MELDEDYELEELDQDYELEDLDEEEEYQLVDLATFGNMVNKAGGNVAFTGDHAVKNIKNEAKGNVMFNDHKKGQKTTVENSTNAGNMKISGNHAFKNATNEKGGKTVLEARKFDAKGNPVKDMLVMLI